MPAVLRRSLHGALPRGCSAAPHADDKLAVGATRHDDAMTPQYGPHRWSAGYHDDGNNDAFRGATFMVADLAGARFVDCDMTGVKIVDAALVDVDVSGYVERLVVNGVDVTDYVDAELDRRHPERVQLRQIEDADGFRAMWDTVERIWSDTVARAERAPRGSTARASRRRVVVRRDAAPPGVHHRLLGQPHDPRRGATVPPARAPADRVRTGRCGRARHGPRRAALVRRGTRRPQRSGWP